MKNVNEYVNSLLAKNKDIRRHQSKLWGMEIKSDYMRLTEIQQFILKVVFYTGNIFQNDLALACKPLVSDEAFYLNLKELVDSGFLWKANKGIGVVIALGRKGVKSLNPFITDNNFYKDTIPYKNLFLYKTIGNMFAGEILTEYTYMMIESFNEEDKEFKINYIVEQYIKKALYKDFINYDKDIPEDEFNKIKEKLNIKASKKNKTEKIKKYYQLIEYGFTEDKASQYSKPRGISSIVVNAFINHFKEEERLNNLKETEDYKLFFNKFFSEASDGDITVKFELMYDYKNSKEFDDYGIVYEIIANRQHNLLKFSYSKVRNQLVEAYSNIKENELKIALEEQDKLKKRYEAIGVNVGNKNLEEINDRVDNLRNQDKSNSFLYAENKLASLKLNYLVLNGHYRYVSSTLTKLHNTDADRDDIYDMTIKDLELDKYLTELKKLIKDLEKQIEIGVFQGNEMDEGGRFNPEPTVFKAFTIESLKDHAIYITGVSQSEDKSRTTVKVSIIDNVSEELSQYILFKRIAMIQGFINGIDSSFKVEITLHCPTPEKYKYCLDNNPFLLRKLSGYFQEFAEIKDNIEVVLEDLKYVKHSDFYKNLIESYRGEM